MNKARVFIFVFIALVSLTVPAWAEDLYVAQSTAGSGTGANCANAFSLSWLNTAGNWGAGTGKVSPGDIVHLCGTFTGQLNIAGSGSSGSPVTILFESNAKFSKAYWATGGGAIYGSGKSYITIDGGANGIVENTANGTALANQQSSEPLYFDTCNNLTVQNLNIQNIYVRTPNSTDFAGESTSLTVWNSQNININHNTLTHSHNMLYLVASTAGTYTGWNIYNNSLNYSADPVIIGDGNANVIIDGVNFYNNTVNGGTQFGFPTGEHWHGDLIHIWAIASGSQMKNMRVYGNTFGPQCAMKNSEGNSATTGWVFVEGLTTNIWVYNNLFITAAGFSGTDGAMVWKNAGSGATGARTYNNTFVGGSTAIETDTFGDVEIKNNIFLNDDVAIYFAGTALATSKIDYNVYYNVKSWNFQTFSAWKSSGFDAHGYNANPALDSNYVPLSTDTVAKDKGVTLSTYFTTDKAGTARPQGSAWDIGAYEFNAGGSGGSSAKPSPPTNLSIH